MERRKSARRVQMRGYGPDRRTQQLRCDGKDNRSTERRHRERRLMDWRVDSKKPSLYRESDARRYHPAYAKGREDL